MPVHTYKGKTYAESHAPHTLSRMHQGIHCSHTRSRVGVSEPFPGTLLHTRESEPIVAQRRIGGRDRLLSGVFT